MYWKESIDYSLIMGNAKVKINKVPGIINKMKELKEIKCGFSHSIAIINGISDNKANDISKKYGIICIPAEDNIVDDKKFDVLKKGETIYVKQDNSNILSWNTALSNFKNLPCNAIIISDHYFYKQAKNASGNLKELIKDLNSDVNYGLTDEKVIVSREKNGENKLVEKKKKKLYYEI